MLVNGFRSCDQETRTRTGETVGSHGEDCWIHRWHPALHHHLPRGHPADEETVRILQTHTHHNQTVYHTQHTHR